MSKNVGPGRPPIGSRFQKGKSGNPKGRPKSRTEKTTSAFDIVIDKTLTVTQGGVPREVTADEALQHRIYHDAIAGNRAARREVLKMIAQRERPSQPGRAETGVRSKCAGSLLIQRIQIRPL